MTPSETTSEEKSSRSYWGFILWPIVPFPAAETQFRASTQPRRSRDHLSCKICTWRAAPRGAASPPKSRQLLPYTGRHSLDFESSSGFGWKGRMTRVVLRIYAIVFPLGDKVTESMSLSLVLHTVFHE